MTQVEMTPQSLIVHITGADRLWTLKSHLEIPLGHVVSATPAADDAHTWLKGVRIEGTHVPGVLSAGIFHHHGDLVFWDVHHAEKAIAITLKDDRFARLVIEVEDPAATIAAITKALPALVAAK